MGMNKAQIGKTYPEQSFTVTKDAIWKYALGINETSPHHFDEGRSGGIVAPPLFGIVFSLPVTGLPLLDPDLNANIMRLVHGEQDMTIGRLARPGEEIMTRGKILNIEEKGTGELITIETESRDKSGERVLLARAGYFIRGERRSGGGEAKKPGSEAQETASNKKTILTAVMEIAKDQTFRYAEGSGDRNPIHLDDSMAKMAGLPGMIVHGMCTLGLATKGIVDKYFDSDPAKVRRVSIRFAKIVFPKDTISTSAWILEKNNMSVTIGFETRNQAGSAVLKAGILEAEV